MAKAKLGSGKRFAALKEKLAKRGDVRDPGAVAAAAGRKKYGKARFQKLAAAGRKRHSPDRYDDTALGETPPRNEFHADFERGTDPQPSAVGHPAFRASDGTDNMRADYRTKEAPILSTPSGGRSHKPSAVDSFNDDEV